MFIRYATFQCTALFTDKLDTNLPLRWHASGYSCPGKNDNQTTHFPEYKLQNEMIRGKVSVELLEKENNSLAERSGITANNVQIKNINHINRNI